MVQFTCPRCKQVFTKKSTYTYHVYERKRPCVKSNSAFSAKTSQIGEDSAPDFRLSKNGNSYVSGMDKNNILTYFKTSRKSHQKMFENSALSFAHIAAPTNSDPMNVSVGKKPSLRQHKTNPSQKPQNYMKDPLKPSQNPHDNSGEKSKHMCNYCLKIFTRADNLSRHIDKYCRIKKQQEAEKEVIFQGLLAKMDQQDQFMNILQVQNQQILAENSLLKNKLDNFEVKSGNNINFSNINSTTNTLNNKTINNNLQNNFNIRLVAFGQEDLSYLTEKTCKFIMKKGFQSVPKLIEHVHFNKNRPEHHNIYIPNMKDMYAMTFDGECWNLIEKSEIIDQLFDDKKLFLEEKFDQFFNSLEDITKKKFKRFLDQQEEDEVKNNIKKDIKLMLYNKRKIPIETRKKLDQFTNVLNYLSNNNLIDGNIESNKLLEN